MKKIVRDLSVFSQKSAAIPYGSEDKASWAFTNFRQAQGQYAHNIHGNSPVFAKPKAFPLVGKVVFECEARFKNRMRVHPPMRPQWGMKRGGGLRRYPMNTRPGCRSVNRWWQEDEYGEAMQRKRFYRKFLLYRNALRATPHQSRKRDSFPTRGKPFAAAPLHSLPRFSAFVRERM